MHKTPFYILLASLPFFSCKHDPEILKTSFDYLDISFNNGTNGVISVYIDSTKIIKVHSVDREKQSSYYQDSLKDSDILLLNRLSNKALALNFDTLAGDPSCYSFPYYLILVNKGKSIRTLVYQGIDKPFEPLDSLTKSITLLTKTIKKNPLDTNFVFHSLQKVLGPPSPPDTETVKFIPQVIMDN